MTALGLRSFLTKLLIFMEKSEFLESEVLKSPEKSLEEREEKDFAVALEEIFSELEKSKLNWRLVGGLALESLSGQSVKPRRVNGTIRDVDVMFLDDNPEEIERLRQFFTARQRIFNSDKSKMAVFPDINFGPTKTKEYLEERKIIKLPQIIPHLLSTAGDYYLHYREVDEKLDPIVLQSHDLLVNAGDQQLKVKTFPAETIIHLYLNRVGSLKPKDISKIKEFLRFNKEVDRSKLDHELYLPFHRFAKRIREKYRITTKALQIYNYIDHKFFHSVFSHKIFPKKLLEFLLEV